MAEHWVRDNMMNRLYTFFLCTLFYSFQASASLNNPYAIGLELGLSRLSNQNSHYAVNNGSGFPSPLNFDNYSINHNNNQSLISIFAGYYFFQTQDWFAKNLLALRYRYQIAQHYSGNITQFNLATFNNYVYRIDTSNQSISLLGKTQIIRWHQLTPYLSGSVGVALNQVGDYSEIANVGVTPRTTPGFKSHTNSEFTYTLGLGIDWALGDELSLSFGYEFQHLGLFISGPGFGSWSNSTLNFGTLQQHIALLTLTFTPIME